MTTLARERSAQPRTLFKAPARARGWRDALPFLPALAVLVSWLAWIPGSGGFFPRDWYPAGVALACVLAVALVAGLGPLPRGRPARIALGLLLGLTAFGFASMLWAEWQGNAWETANKLLLYAIGAWIVMITPWSERSATAFVGAWAVGVAAICALFVVGAAGSDNPLSYFIEEQFAEPLGYTNGSAGLAVLAFWPLVAFSARGDLPLALQALLAGLAVFVLEFSVLLQSRASVIGLVLVALLLVALAPERLRMLSRLAIAGGALALALDPLLDVYRVAVDRGSLPSALDEAGTAMLASCLLAMGATVALVMLERRLSLSPDVVRRGRTAAGFGVMALALAALVVAIASAGAISDELSERWDTFKEGEAALVDDGGPRVSNLSDPKRYDFWEVSVDAWRDEPLAGIGAGNWERVYTAERSFPKNSRFAHSIWLHALSEGGLIAAGLLVGLVLAIGLGIAAAMRRTGVAGRVVVAACAAAGAYFLVHASLDWLEEIPALAAPALALPLVAVALGAGAGRPGRPRVRLALRVGGVALVAAGAVSLLFPYMSLRQVEDAREGWRSDYAEAMEQLDRAGDLDPLSAQPEIARGLIAVSADRPEEARAAFERAISLEESWLSRFELAMLDAEAGRFAEARRQIDRARELDPQEPLLVETAERIDRRERIDPRSVHREIVNQTLADG